MKTAIKILSVLLVIAGLGMAIFFVPAPMISVYCGGATAALAMITSVIYFIDIKSRWEE